MRELLHNTMNLPFYYFSNAIKISSDISEPCIVSKVEGVSGNRIGTINLIAYKTGAPCLSKPKFLYI